MYVILEYSASLIVLAILAIFAFAVAVVFMTVREGIKRLAVAAHQLVAHDSGNFSVRQRPSSPQPEETFAFPATTTGKLTTGSGLQSIIRTGEEELCSSGCSSIAR